MKQKHAVVIRFSALGDVVLTTPVLEELRRQGFDKITFVTKAGFAPLLMDDPRVDHLVLLGDSEYTDSTAIQSVSNLLFLARKIRGLKPTLIVDLHQNLRSNLLRPFLFGIPRVVIDKRSLQRRYRKWTGRWQEGLPHITQRYLYALSGQAARSETPSLYVNPKARASLQHKLSGSSGPVVGMVIGAAWRTKRWPIESFVALAEQLHTELGAIVLWLGGQSEKEFDAYVAKCGGWSINLIAQTNLQELMAATEVCDLVIANDTGAMHMATAVGTPVVALFGPTARALGFWPTGPYDVIAEVDDLACRPCTLHGDDACPLGHHACMNDLALATVARMSKSVLEREREVL